jgi:hypothetical protein
MAYGKEYIPDNDAKFDAWVKNFLRYILGKMSGSTPAWTHIPQAVIDLLNDLYAVWYLAYGKTVVPHLPPETEAKNDAKKALKKAVRACVNQYLRFAPVTDEDRTAMGIPNHDSTRTPIGTPETVPVYNVVIKGIRKITITFHDEDTESHAIPYGMNGAIVSWKVSDAPVTDPKLFDRTELATKSPAVIHFEEADRGKTASIALQWQNEKGDRGDFSEVEKAIVP